MTCTRVTLSLKRVYLWRTLITRGNKFFSSTSQTNQISLFDFSLRPSVFSPAHTALAPTIEIGSLEWMDTTHIDCVRH